MNTTDDLLSGLPGEQIIRSGLRDLDSGALTPAACLIMIGRSRLDRVGVRAKDMKIPDRDESAEMTLYRLLQDAHSDDPYGRYNSLIRLLVSFENALEHRVRWMMHDN